VEHGKQKAVGQRR